MNDNMKYVALTIVVAVFIPQLITVLSMKSEGRKISADKVPDCGINSYHDGETCICETCYAKDSSGECTMCVSSCYESMGPNGQRVCTEQSGTDDLSAAVKASIGISSVNESDIHKVSNMYDVSGLNLYPANQFTVDEDVPGPYPNFAHYDQAEYSTVEEVLRSNFDAEVNLADWTPYLPSTHYGSHGENYSSGGHGGAYRLMREQPKISRTEIQGELPEMEEILHNGVLSRDTAADYAVNGMGRVVDSAESQLTEWSTGDIMTSYKPIDSTHRPFSRKEMVERLGETENVRVLNGVSNISSGPVTPDNLGGCKESEVEGRKPYPTSSADPETSLYWQSELPKRPNSNVNGEMWQIGNAFSSTGSANLRKMEFRNAPEPIIPNTKGGGFYGSILNPMDEDRGGVETREEERINPIGRLPVQEHNLNMERTEDIMRDTSNKVADNENDIHPVRNDFITRQDVLPPTRDSVGFSRRQLTELPFYSTANVHIASNELAFDRTELLAVGPAHVTG